MLIGIGAVAYPHVAAWQNQYYQNDILAAYEKTKQNASPPLHSQIEQAQAYNRALRFFGAVKAGERIPVGQKGGGDIPGFKYADLLSSQGAGGIMGRVRIPKINVDLPIYHGSDEATLLKGVGHLEGTSLPVGGKNTHAVLTAHRGLAEAKYFTDLNKLNKGDVFTVSAAGQDLAYRVTNMQVVSPQETQVLRLQPGKDLVTLVTCTPLGINSHRIIVTAQRITPTPEAYKHLPPLTPYPWALAIAGTLAVLTIVFTVFLILPPKKEKDRDSN
ncbi:class C sortase [Gleimia hominis]|uniref:Class C sortase n=2 Tax=Gleimia hominis TaxID=595468 RepID=A0ABU3ICU4_9ACTO|nr:class C sortase [Gleimia hominis]